MALKDLRRHVKCDYDLYWQLLITCVSADRLALFCVGCCSLFPGIQRTRASIDYEI